MSQGLGCTWTSVYMTPPTHTHTEEPQRSWLSSSGYCKAPYLNLRSSLSFWGSMKEAE